MLAFFRKIYYNMIWHYVLMEQKTLVGYQKGMEHEKSRNT